VNLISANFSSPHSVGPWSQRFFFLFLKRNWDAKRRRRSCKVAASRLKLQNKFAGLSSFGTLFSKDEIRCFRNSEKGRKHESLSFSRVSAEWIRWETLNNKLSNPSRISARFSIMDTQKAVPVEFKFADSSIIPQKQPYLIGNIVQKLQSGLKLQQSAKFILFIYLFIYSHDVKKSVWLINFRSCNRIRNPWNFCCWNPESRGLESRMYTDMVSGTH